MNSVAKKYLVGEMSFKRLWKSVLSVVAVVYVVLILWVVFFSNSMIFKPRASSYEENMFFKRLELAGDTVAFEYRTVKDTTAYTVLISHGNAEDIGDISFITGAFEKAGFNCIAYDYPGYGLTPGTPSEEGCNRTIEAVYNYLTTSQKVPAEKIILLGRSMGSGPSCYLAARKPVGGLILESAFSSAVRVLTGVKILPVDKFDNLAELKKVKVPTLIIHGKKDEVIPFSHGEMLLEKAPRPKFSLFLDEAAHNDVMVVGGAHYWGGIMAFTTFLSGGEPTKVMSVKPE